MFAIGRGRHTSGTRARRRLLVRRYERRYPEATRRLDRRGRHLGDALSARLSAWRFGGALDPRVGWDALRHVLWRGAAHLRSLDVSGCGLAGALPLGILQLKVGGCAVDDRGHTIP